MAGLLPAQQADQFLDAYASERQRAQAVRCLGWIALRLGPGELTWWKIPDLAPAKSIRTTRRLVMLAVLAVDAVVVAATTSWAGAVIFLAVCAFLFLGGRRRPPVRRTVPLAIGPRWLGWDRLVGLFFLMITTAGLAFFPVLLAQWTVPAQPATVYSSYRSDRRSSVLNALSGAPCGAFLGAIGFVAAYGTPGWPAGVLLTALTLSAAVWLGLGSSYSYLKLTELSLAATWREPVSFLRVLDTAERNGLLLRTGAGYAFRDSALRQHFAALGQAASPVRQEPAPTSARARNALRAWCKRLLRRVLLKPEPGDTPPSRRLSAVAAWLSKSRISRITFDFGSGAALAALAAYLATAIPRGDRIGTMVISSILLPLVGFVVAAVGGGILLRLTAAAARRAAPHLPILTRKARIGIALAVIAAGAALVAGAGTFLAAALAFLMPSAFVTACGLWLCVLAVHRWRTSPRRWLKLVPDQLAVAASAATLLVTVDRQLLTTQWATVLLFPIGIAGSLRLWTIMRKAERLTVRAGADIALSLLLGGQLVLLLVWLANVLAMPRSEVALIRTRLSSAGSYAGAYDGGRLWAGLYAALAVASLIFVLYPAKLNRIAKWFDQLSLAQVASVAQRVATGLYIGILVIVFVGVAGPSALTPLLQRQLSTAYDVSLQRELATEAQTSAANEISAEITALTPPSTVAALVYLIEDIHQDAHQPADAPGATPAEAALAHRLGQDQAAALALATVAPAAPAEPSPARPAESSQPGGGAQQLSDLATETATEETASDQAARHLKTAFELAVTGVTNALPIPDISKNEVSQILTQYLTGLVDDSKVTEAFETWIEQHRKKPPTADDLIIPNPGNLDTASGNDLTREATAHDVTVIPDPSALPPLSASAVVFGQAMIADAVESATQAEQVQQTGGCSACFDIGNDDGTDHNHDDDGSDVHVGE